LNFGIYFIIAPLDPSKNFHYHKVMTEHNVSISYRTILLTIFTLIGLLVIFLIKDILLAIFLAVIIMSALNPAVTSLEKKKIPRPLGIFLMYVTIIGILALLIFLIVPPLGKELNNLLKVFKINDLPTVFSELKFDINGISTLLSQYGGSVGSLINILTSTFSSIIFFFTTLVLGFYLLLERKELHEKGQWLIQSGRVQNMAEQMIDEMEIQLGGWVRGQSMLMIVIGLITFISLTLLNVPYALPLAVLAGLLEILPNIGPTIAAMPAIFVAFLVDPRMALIVMLFYIIVQQIENNLLVPKIMKAAVNVDPLVSIVAVLIGVQLGGVLGALLAIPTYIFCRSFFRIYKSGK
jgi:predicted PurR-regulated permease PerM